MPARSAAEDLRGPDDGPDLADRDDVVRHGAVDRDPVAALAVNGSVGRDERERALAELPALGVDDLELAPVVRLEIGAATLDLVHRQDAAVVRADGTRFGFQAHARTRDESRGRGCARRRRHARRNGTGGDAEREREWQQAEAMAHALETTRAR